MGHFLHELGDLLTDGLLPDRVPGVDSSAHLPDPRAPPIPSATASLTQWELLPRRFAPTSPRLQLAQMAAWDPAFSETGFEDFLGALYRRAQEARGRGKLGELSAYLGPAARVDLAPSAVKLRAVEDIIVGGLLITAVEGLEEGAPAVTVTVRFQTNYTEVAEAGGRHSFWAVEGWRLSRPKTARSRDPRVIRSLHCPACGAPLTQIVQGRCAHCRRAVTSGGFDWFVESVGIVEKTDAIPEIMGVDGGEAEEHPTFIDEDAQSRLERYYRADPDFSWDVLYARVREMFAALQRAWETLDFAATRAFVSDGLYEANRYGAQIYRLRKCRLKQGAPRVFRLELARLAEDAYHDAITVRVFIRGLYYAATDTGYAVVGLPSEEHVYSEYWTLLRTKGVHGRVPHPVTSCPNCGAPLAIAMGGDCRYCRAHVTAGEYDWVLSRIEEPEAYR